jgi:hypothetical protein
MRIHMLLQIRDHTSSSIAFLHSAANSNSQNMVGEVLDGGDIGFEHL